MTEPRRALLVAATIVLVLSLGMPWTVYAPNVAGAAATGFQETARVTAAAGAVVFLVGLRRRQRTVVLVALAIASIGVLVGLHAAGLGSGRIAYALAIALAAAGSGLTPARAR